MRCGASSWASRIRCTDRRLSPAAFAGIRPGQWVWFSRWRPERQVDNPLHGVGRRRLFAGRARLIARQPFDALCHKPRLPSPHHWLRFARLAHILGRAAAVGLARMMLARQKCLCRALRSNTIASNPRRPAHLTFTTFPTLMLRG
jgi:hypothetical protein